MASAAREVCCYHQSSTVYIKIYDEVERSDRLTAMRGEYLDELGGIHGHFILSEGVRQRAIGETDRKLTICVP